MKKKNTMLPKSWADIPVSARIVGDRTASTCRSTNESHEHNAIPMHGIHMRQPWAAIASDCSASHGGVAADAGDCDPLGAASLAGDNRHRAPGDPERSGQHFDQLLVGRAFYRRGVEA